MGRIDGFMEKLQIKETAETPFVSFDAETGEMEMRGRSIPEDADEFWLPVLSWFESFMLNPTSSIIVKLDLEYFNISSSKRILFLLYKLNELVEAGKDAKVEWHYKKSDIDMYEVGQDYAYMVKVPFEFVSYNEMELANI
ncbi:MAG: DUF1987 domain-containing protein [Crocinitomicaceae bacterium]|nr:DUF1987 domain-containing protein [Flavobacteriales bacterium]NQZ37944.1 DUF1987 domain-containing protein [Crocinitomicaceae bacterium]